MHKRFHKWVIVWLILVISTPGLLYIYYEAAQLRLHVTMEIALERMHLQEIKIPITSLQWEREGKELQIHGKMFDVHSMKRVGNTMYLVGLFDEQETNIKKELTRLKQTSQQENQSEQYIINHWHRWHWIHNFRSPLHSITRSTFSSKKEDYLQYFIPAVYPPSPFQPPDFVSFDTI